MPPLTSMAASHPPRGWQLTTLTGPATAVGHATQDQAGHRPATTAAAASDVQSQPAQVSRSPALYRQIENAIHLLSGNKLACLFLELFLLLFRLPPLPLPTHAKILTKR